MFVGLGAAESGRAWHYAIIICSSSSSGCSSSGSGSTSIASSGSGGGDPYLSTDFVSVMFVG